jgi:(p)ppGpp synthase/HD superfamily hydrolase
LNFDKIRESVLRELLQDFEPGMERRAWRYAKRKHDDTHAVRKASGSPYFVHPESAAKLLKDLGASDFIVVSSLCHDLQEDAGATHDDIVEKFGQRVADLVEEVTNDEYASKSVGKERYMNQKMLNMSNDALTVKLADVAHNIVDFPRQDQKDRMLNNVNYVIDNRRLDDIQKKLADAILAIGEDK